MKKLDWKQWVILAVALIVVIAEIILIFISPLAAIWGAACGFAGYFARYLYKTYFKNKLS